MRARCGRLVRWKRPLVQRNPIGVTCGYPSVSTVVSLARVSRSRFNSSAIPLSIWLERLQPTAPVRLARVVAVAEAFGPQRGLALLDQLDREHHLTDDPLVTQRAHAVRAHLFERLGDHGRAADHYRISAGLTDNAAERRYLLERIGRQGEAMT